MKIPKGKILQYVDLPLEIYCTEALLRMIFIMSIFKVIIPDDFATNAVGVKFEIMELI